MFDAFDAHGATTPDGVEWRIGRRWLTRRLRRSLRWRHEASGEMAAAVEQGVPTDVSEVGVLVVVGLVALA
jgi:hypothetical protein